MAEAPGAALAVELRALAEHDGAARPWMPSSARPTASPHRGPVLPAPRPTVDAQADDVLVYGNWALGLSVNEFPPSVAYLFGKQIYDDSTHEMQYVDEIRHRRRARTQREAFRHPYCAFTPASRVAYFVFALRAGRQGGRARRRPLASPGLPPPSFLTARACGARVVDDPRRPTGAGGAPGHLILLLSPVCRGADR